MSQEVSGLKVKYTVYGIDAKILQDGEYVCSVKRLDYEGREVAEITIGEKY